MYFLFLLITKSNSLVPDEFYTTDPCDCDVTNMCDEYCCCDLDCSAEAISNFSLRFCLPTSKDPITTVICDPTGEIKRTNKVNVTTSNGYTCYSYTKSLGNSDRITNYESADLSNLNFSTTIPTPTLPATSTSYLTMTSQSGTTTDSIPIYWPIAVSSEYCNSYVLLMRDQTYSTSCQFASPDATTPTNADILGTILSGNDTTTAGVGATLTLTSTGVSINATSDSIFTIQPETATTAAAAATASFLEFDSPSFIRSARQTALDPDQASSTKGGYQFGVSLVSLTLDATTNTQTRSYFQFGPNLTNIEFGTDSSFVVDNTTLTGTNADLSTYIPVKTIASTYGPLGTETTITENVTLTTTIADDLSTPKRIIYTLLYKKFGYYSSFYYKIIGSNLQVLNASQNVNYHTIEFKQLEISDDATTQQPPSTLGLASARFSQITDFMFMSGSNSVETTAIICVVIIIILIWLDSLFID